LQQFRQPLIGHLATTCPSHFSTSCTIDNGQYRFTMPWVYRPTKTCKRKPTTLLTESILEALVTKDMTTAVTNLAHCLTFQIDHNILSRLAWVTTLLVCIQEVTHVKYRLRHWLSCICLWFSSVPLAKCWVRIYNRPQLHTSTSLLICYYHTIIWNSTLNDSIIQQTTNKYNRSCFWYQRKILLTFPSQDMNRSNFWNILSITTLYNLSIQ
jgi:hypothetical protein